MSIAKPSPQPSTADPAATVPGKPTSEPATTTDAQPPLRPELQQALEESWKKNEPAYRYLGR